MINEALIRKIEIALKNNQACGSVLETLLEEASKETPPRKRTNKKEALVQQFRIHDKIKNNAK